MMEGLAVLYREPHEFRTVVVDSVDWLEPLIWKMACAERISEDPAWFECRFCDHHDLCHGDAAAEVTCGRACIRRRSECFQKKWAPLLRPEARPP
jgi:hypothetical protein